MAYILGFILGIQYIKYLNYLNFIPKKCGSIISSLMEKIPSQDNYMSYFFILKHVSRGFGWPPHQQVFRWMSPFSDKNITQLFNQDFANDFYKKNIWDTILPNNKKVNKNITDELSNIFLKLYLPNDILTKVDRVSMYNGLEVRSPFLSKEIINFSLNLENKYKLYNGKTKLILRKLSKQKLPDEIIKRNKHGFAIPLAKMMRGPLKEKIEDTLLSSNNNISKYFDRVNIEKSLREHWKGIDNRKTIWAIYVLYKTSERLSKL